MSGSKGREAGLEPGSRTVTPCRALLVLLTWSVRTSGPMRARSLVHGYQPRRAVELPGLSGLALADDFDFVGVLLAASPLIEHGARAPPLRPRACLRLRARGARCACSTALQLQYNTMFSQCATAASSRPNS